MRGSRRYDVLAPARWISSVLSDDLAVGFAIANGMLVTFGLWCYLARVAVALGIDLSRTDEAAKA